MINRDDIQVIAAKKQLHPSVIEKDYVIGWILAGISTHPEIKTVGYSKEEPA